MADRKLFDFGERLILSKFLEEGGALTLRLCTLPTTFTDDMADEDFTEATFNGYAPTEMDAGALAAGNPGGQAVLTWDAITLTKEAGGASENISGYWVADSDGNPLFGETFDPVKAMSTTGDQITINPKFFLESKY